MNGRIYTFTPVKGGDGATTLACLTAAFLARSGEGPVLLLDWNSPSRGDMEAHLAMKGALPSLGELEHRRGSLSPSLLRGLAHRHPAGFDVLAAQGREGPPAGVSFMEEAIPALRGLYGFILIDTASRGEAFDQAAAISNRVFAVVRPDTAGLAALRSFEKRTASSQHPPGLFRILPNRTPQSRSALRVASEQSKFSLADVVIDSYQEDLDLAEAAGSFPLMPPKSRLGLACQALAALIHGDPGFAGPKESSALQANSLPRRRALREKLYRKLVEREDLLLSNSGEAGLASRVKAAAEDLVSSESGEDLAREERALLVKEIVQEAIGLGPLEELLEDPEVTEIMVNGSTDIYVEKGGRLYLTDRSFVSEAQLRGIIERIVSPLGRRIDESSPYVDARLPDGSRVNAIIPPLALGGPCVTIRKFSSTRLTLEDLVAKGSLTPAMADFLSACVHGRLNILVSGGTGSGKTTLLNITAGAISPDERIVTIEDSAELKLPQEHVIRLESRAANLEGQGQVTIRDLVRNALRMRPDRIVVGECRGGEALDMLQAMNTGHDGSLTTAHANTPRDMLSRLETMVMMSGMDLPSRAIREQIASALDLIVHVGRLRDGSRKVEQVVEVLGMEGDVIVTQPLFRYVQDGYEDGKVRGHFEACGIRPAFMGELESAGIHLDPEIFQNKKS